MIECVDENIYYRKRKKTNKKKLKKIFVFFLFILIFVLYSKLVLSSISYFANKKIDSISTEVLNEVIIANYNYKYSDIINIEKNNNNEIILIDTNSTLINKISGELSNNIKSNLDKKLQDGIKIPWLAFLGLKIFSGYGIEVNFKTIEINKVNAEIKTEFISEGINQTLHRIFLQVEIKTNIFLPILKNEIVTTKNVLICESVIVGKIPQVYLQK